MLVEKSDTEEKTFATAALEFTFHSYLLLW
jgi:hypothetical protein